MTPLLRATRALRQWRVVLAGGRCGTGSTFAAAVEAAR